MAKSKSDPIPANFEDALSQLDMIVEDLEGEAVPLADLVNQYDRGMKLLEACQVKLDEAKWFKVANILPLCPWSLSDTFRRDQWHL